MPLNVDMTRRNQEPRPLKDSERARLEEFIEMIHYSARYAHQLTLAPRWWSLPLTWACSYSDDEYEYRHVQLPKAMLKAIPKEYHDTSKGTLKLLWEDEWRAMGITQVCRVLRLI